MFNDSNSKQTTAYNALRIQACFQLTTRNIVQKQYGSGFGCLTEKRLASSPQMVISDSAVLRSGQCCFLGIGPWAGQARPLPSIQPGHAPGHSQAASLVLTCPLVLREKVRGLHPNPESGLQVTLLGNALEMYEMFMVSCRDF